MNHISYLRHNTLSIQEFPDLTHVSLMFERLPKNAALPRTHKKTARSDGSDTGGLVLLKGCIFSVLRVCSYFLTKISRARLESMANSEYPTRKMYDGKTCMSTMLLPGRTPMAMSLRILMSSPVAR